MPRVKLNDHEKEVLFEMACVDSMDLEDENGQGYEYDAKAYCFSYFTNERLDRKAVRRACRSLWRKGLAQFARGLSDEDGNLRGSGYHATQDGLNLAFELAKEDEAKEKQAKIV